jgi:hypothetical protein
MASDRYVLSPEDARDVLAVLADDHDHGGPLARTLHHLGHLSEESRLRIADLACALLAELQPSPALHESPERTAWRLGQEGPDSVLKDRAYDCRPCRASLPSWRRGVCRVCGGPARHERSYYCSDEHRGLDRGPDA